MVEFSRQPDETVGERTPLFYALHSGNLYGTERMALATAQGLVDAFRPVIFAPNGPAIEEAVRLGFETETFESPLQFALRLRQRLAATSGRVAFFATGVVHSLACVVWNLLYRRRVAHLHMVHGGTDERLSYGRKRLLRHTRARYVAVSSFVRERLVAHGVPEAKIDVVENFLSDDYVASAPQRSPFNEGGVRRIVVVSRLDAIKRIDVLFDALERTPELSDMSVRILGTGELRHELRARAEASDLDITFLGFTPDAPQELADADLLVHTCPVEPFGLAIIEAMAAGTPVLAPGSGGAGSLIEDGVSGFHFSANSAEALGDRLKHLRQAPADELNVVVEGGRRALATRFSASERLADYRRLLEAELR